MSNGCKEERHFALTNSIELNFSFNVYLTFLFSTTTTTTMVKANSAKGRRSLQQQGFTESMSKTERVCVKERETEKECAIEGELSRWGKKHHQLFPVSILIRACTYICVCVCVCACLLCVERLCVCVCVPGLIVPMAVA